MKRDLDTKGLDGGEDEDAIAIFQSSAAPDALDPQDGYWGRRRNVDLLEVVAR